ncbi:MAG TPA: hypothetical protein VK564_13360 [Thermodesulfobacteriota bacterium]|nr:hypothetical protein [Thermodesulfobacteriota bacterium]
MDEKVLICVDCYDKLKMVSGSPLMMFYCDNIKCRRFGVLTIGGLSGAKCEKNLVIRSEDAPAKNE